MIANYHNAPYAVLLEIILILVAVHGFNGLRIIFIELRQGKRWEESVTVISIAATMAIIGYGTRTILIASGLGVT